MPPARLVHESGGFFSIDHVRVRDAQSRTIVDRPFINQPEIGILGMLLADIAGAPHVLLQTKFEPGNVHDVQLAPTVQATYSNYRRVHGGAATRFLDRFVDPSAASVLCDLTQPEHAPFFLHKCNRNIVIRLERPIDTGPTHRWISLEDVLTLLGEDHTVNMDARSVLACLRFGSSDTSFEACAGIEAWLSARAAARAPMRVEHVGLRAAADGMSLVPADGSTVEGIAIAVRADDREVPYWTQPLLSIAGCGMLGLLVRKHNGRIEALCQAFPNFDSQERWELGPTLVRYGPHRNVALPFTDRFAEGVPSSENRVYDARQCEEGGRFYKAASRYVIVESADDSAHDAPPPPDYSWFTLKSVAAAVAARRATIELRNLLACLPQEYRI